MSRKAREIETLLLAMFAAVPLYLNAAVGAVPLLVFHGVMAAILVRVIAGKGPELIPTTIMRALAIAYIPFYVIDAAVISRSAIAASTHLVLFIAAYQPSESMRSRNQAQRMLTAGLIFIASLATSTHITVVLFVVVFAFLAFRQLMYVSHLETVHSIDREDAEAPSSRSAAWYVAGATLLGALLFPVLPRVRNPLVQGIADQLSPGATGLSESINLNEPRTTLPDPTVVARVWMGREAIPFFTPLRLRGTVYERFDRGEWKQRDRGLRYVLGRDGVFSIARPSGFTRTATVQTRLQRGRLFVPTGTYAITGLTNLYEGPSRDAYYVFMLRGGDLVSFDARMAFQIEPLRVQRVPLSNYPVTPAVAQLARGIVGNATSTAEKAQRVERYMTERFTYVANPANIGRNAMTVDDFLLRVRRGHCEYFAAGMVALMTAVDVPARIVGGFYGGRLNPLTGYFTIRREDAHAWVEVWDGAKWLTFDPTPASLRPGSQQEGMMQAYASALADSVNYFWDRYILTYGLSDQINLAIEMLTRARNAMQAMRESFAGAARRMTSQRFALILCVIVAAGLAAIVFRRARRPLYELLAIQLARRGIPLGSAMTMEDALRDLREKHPDAARDLEPLIALYEEERFSSRHDRARVAVIRRGLAALKT